MVSLCFGKLLRHHHELIQYQINCYENPIGNTAFGPAPYWQLLRHDADHDLPDGRFGTLCLYC